MRELGFPVKAAYVALVRIALSGLVATIPPQLTYAGPELAYKLGLTCAEVKKLQKQETAALSDKELFALAGAYEYGVCVEQDYKQAYDGYRAAVERGGNLSKVKLGNFYLTGPGLDRDLGQARHWFRSYALASFTEPDNFMVALLQEAVFDAMMPDMLQEEIDRAIDDGKGSVKTWMRNYRDLYEGNGVYPDRSRAMRWLHSAVMARHPLAYYEKAHRALEDQGDFDAYKFNLILAAEGNHSPAQVDYGKLFLTGEGTRKWAYMAVVRFLRAQKNGLNVDELIQEAERQLHPLDHKSAVMRAAEFDSGRTMQ